MICSMLLGAGLLLVVQYLVPYVFRKIGADKPVALNEKNWKLGMVYLYQRPGTKVLPSVSPFCVKLETFLRLYKIPFERRYTLLLRGVDGRTSFVEFNGEQIADCALIIDRLIEQFKIKEYVNENLFFHYKVTRTPERFFKAILGTYLPESFIEFLTPIIAPIISSLVHGWISAVFGEYLDADFDKLVHKDLAAYRDILGQKKFLLGDSITTADCAVFGHLSATYFLNQDSFPMRTLKSPEFSALVDYIERVRYSVFRNEFQAN